MKKALDHYKIPQITDDVMDILKMNTSIFVTSDHMNYHFVGSIPNNVGKSSIG